jgi:glycerol-3-phosphate acyltransferase PlsY
MEKFYFVLVIVIAYFLGNISPSTILARARGVDIKSEGSGNAGTTNTLRVLGPKAALITLIVDISKGALAVAIGLLISTPTAAMWCALSVFIGHVWPVFLKFKGGKGVASAFGAVVTLDWRLGLLSLLIVALAVLLTRKVSLGSIIVGLAFPIECYFLKPEFIYLGTIMAVLLLFKHRSNFVRLIHGEEDSISFSKFKKKGEK